METMSETAYRMKSDPVVDGNVGLAYIIVVRAFCSLFPDELHPGSFTTEQEFFNCKSLCGLQKKLRVVSGGLHFKGNFPFPLERVHVGG